MKKTNSTNAKKSGRLKANSKRTRKKMDALEKKKIIASLTLRKICPKSFAEYTPYKPVLPELLA